MDDLQFLRSILERGFNPTQPRDEEGQWTVVRGRQVSIKNKPVHKNHIGHIADQLGVSPEGKEVLIRGWEQGKIKTDNHLLRAISHGLEAGGHEDHYKEGVSNHGHKGKHEGRATKAEGPLRDLHRVKSLSWSGDAQAFYLELKKAHPDMDVKSFVDAAEKEKKDQGFGLTNTVDIDNLQAAAKKKGLKVPQSKVMRTLRARSTDDDLGPFANV